MFGKFIAILLIGGCIALCVYFGVGIVRDIKERKNKKEDKNNNKEV